MAYKQNYTSKMVKSARGNTYKLERINGTWIFPVTDTRYYVFKEVGERKIEVWKHESKPDGSLYEDGSRVKKVMIGIRASRPACLSIAERYEFGGKVAKEIRKNKKTDG